MLQDEPPAPPAEPTPVELMEVTTSDGQVLKMESTEVGASVTLVTTEGETPAPNGTYELENKDSIVVEAGLIKDYLAFVEEKPVNQEEMAAIVSKLSALETKMSAFESTNKVLVEENKKLKLAFSEAISAIQEFAELEQPAPAAPAEPAKQLARHEQIAKQFKNN